VSSYLNNARGRLKASSQAAESHRDHCAYGEAVAAAATVDAAGERTPARWRIGA
jgi:hypothetical protein